MTVSPQRSAGRAARCPRLVARVAALVVAAVACAAAFAADGAASAAPTSGIDRSTMDPSVRAQDDLFRHVNGRWLADTPFPPDRAYIGAFVTIHDETQVQLRALIEEAAAAADSVEARQIGDLYASFMDEAALEPLGVSPLAAELANIDALSDRRQLAALFARLDRLGVASPIGIAIEQDARDATRYVTTLAQSGLGLPDRDYYLQLDDKRFREVRERYVHYVARMLTLSGTPAERAAADAQAVLGFESALARIQWTQVQNRDPVKTYNRVDAAALARLAPTIDWAAHAQVEGYAGRTPALVVYQPSYLAALDPLLQATPLDALKAYARLRLVGSFAPYLSREFVDTRFDFVGRVLQGTTENLPRWKRGVALVEGSVGESLGKLYVARHFPPERQARMEQLVANLLEACRRSLARLDWMGPATRREALAKLAKFTPKIGYPKRWIDYGSLRIDRGDLVGNVIRARAFEHERQLAKLGRPVDRDEWFLTPQTVNAYYNPALNEVVFPASILHPPFFDAAADDAVNYGAIGAVIGHEISHGFDDSGSQYDGDGNLRNWWSRADRRRFEQRAKRLVAQYGRFEPVPGYRVNGQLTLGENIADNAGLAIAYDAWQLSLGGRPSPVIDGLSGDERFFYGFAQVWRGKVRDAAMVEQLKSDPHAPDEIRANGTVRNHPDFYSTFKLRPGDKLYLPPAQRVRLW